MTKRRHIVVDTVVAWEVEHKIAGGNNVVQMAVVVAAAVADGAAGERVIKGFSYVVEADLHPTMLKAF